MQNLEIIRSFKIKARFTGEDWHLFTDSMDCSYAVREINSQLQLSVNTHTARHDVQREMEGVLAMYRQYGAEETEPHHFLNEVLDFIYGSAYSDC